MVQSTKPSECVSSKEVGISFSLRWVFFLTMFYSLLSIPSVWHCALWESKVEINSLYSWIKYINNEKLHRCLKDSQASSMFGSLIPLLQIRPCFRKEFWNKIPYINDVIFILNSSFLLEFAIELSYLFPAVELWIGYITRMRNIFKKIILWHSVRHSTIVKSFSSVF
jgi:hypothetical protein